MINLITRKILKLGKICMLGTEFFNVQAKKIDKQLFAGDSLSVVLDKGRCK